MKNFENTSRSSPASIEILNSENPKPHQMYPKFDNTSPPYEIKEYFFRKVNF
jgi:hypothetical protein